MKNLLILILLFVMLSEAQAQEKYFTKAGFAKFYSDAPLEDIEAINNKVQSIIDMQKNDIVINVPITGFQFGNSLMQEHFNENYLESEKFPSAAFQGYFESQTAADMSKPGVYEVIVKGNMTIHGVTKRLSTVGVIKVGDNKIIASTVFNIKVADYEIKIPTMVFRNIAEEVEVTVELQYLPFKG